MLKNIIFTLFSLLALATSPATLAEDQVPAAAETAPAPSMPAEPVQEAIKQTTISTRPSNENHNDFRYCLELKSDREIAECRYKK